MTGFQEACRTGNLNLVKEIYYNEIIDKIQIFRGIRLACYEGEFEIIKWLWEKNSSYRKTQYFRTVCWNGHLEIAKWMIDQNSDLEVHIEGNHIFRAACAAGYIELAMWLWSLGGIEWCCGFGPSSFLYDNNELIFQWMCSNKFYKLVKWFFFLNTKLCNIKIPEKILNKFLKVNIFESTQVDLITMYTKLVIS